MGKREEIRANRARLVAECLASEQSVGAWCEEHGVPRTTMSYWMDEVRDEEVALAESALASRPAFVEVDLARAPAPARPAVTVELAGATVTVPAGADPACVSAVLSALAAAV